jgi:Ca-activated chloride channel family protein
MIGLAAFARTTQVLSPLTLNHKDLIDQLNKLEIMRIQDQDGTGIGYAIYKTANLIAATRHYAQRLQGQGKPAYDIKDAVMILVTDGMQDPNPLDKDNRYRWMDPEQAAAFSREQNIRLYIVNIDPEFAKPKWEANRKQLQRAAESTGGHFYALDASSSIAKVYKEIDALAKSTLPMPAPLFRLAADQPDRYATVWLYPWLIAIGAGLLAAALLLQTTWLRTVP